MNLKANGLSRQAHNTYPQPPWAGPRTWALTKGLWTRDVCVSWLYLLHLDEFRSLHIASQSPPTIITIVGLLQNVYGIYAHTFITQGLPLGTLL
jgi:hypothetical protein